MDIEVKKTDDASLLIIRGDLNIYSAPDLVVQLRESFNTVSKVALDLTGVSEVDTAGLQTLIAAKMESVKTHKTLKLLNHSPVMIKMIDLMGLVGFFGDKIKIPSEDRKKYSFKYGIKKVKMA